MRQYFRLNVKSEGYVLYAGAEGRPFTPQSLGIESSEVPEAFLQVQRRIDAAVKGASGWSLAVHHPGHDRRPILAYGNRIDAPDEFGRSGLTFLHGIELDGPEQLRAAVVGVLLLVAGDAGEALVRGVERTAVGATPRALREFLNGLARSLEAAIEEAGPITPDSGRPYSSVTHDCGGAAAGAWLALAEQQASCEPPWSFFDVVEKGGKVVTTVVPQEGEATTASQLLMKASFASRPQDQARKWRLRASATALMLFCVFVGLLWQSARVTELKREAERSRQLGDPNGATGTAPAVVPAPQESLPNDTSPVKKLPPKEHPQVPPPIIPNSID